MEAAREREQKRALALHRSRVRAARSSFSQAPELAATSAEPQARRESAAAAAKRRELARENERLVKRLVSISAGRSPVATQWQTQTAQRTPQPSRGRKAAAQQAVARENERIVQRLLSIAQGRSSLPSLGAAEQPAFMERQRRAQDSRRRAAQEKIMSENVRLAKRLLAARGFRADLASLEAAVPARELVTAPRREEAKLRAAEAKGEEALRV